MAGTPKLTILLVTFAGGLLADLTSKAWIVAELAESDRRVVIDGLFSVTHVRNPGVAFGLLSSLPGSLRVWVLVALSIVATVLVARYFSMAAPRDRVTAFALGLVLGGALGNLVDRVLHGAVLDFLHFELAGRYSSPSFNLADLFIVTGVATLIFEATASEAARRADVGEKG